MRQTGARHEQAKYKETSLGGLAVNRPRLLNRHIAPP
jgi:hypothetical protein